MNSELCSFITQCPMLLPFTFPLIDGLWAVSGR